MSYRISELMKVLKLNERTVRKLLVDAGANLVELDQDTSERVTRQAVIDLWADRVGTREQRLLSQLLIPTRARV